MTSRRYKIGSFNKWRAHKSFALLTTAIRINKIRKNNFCFWISLEVKYGRLAIDPIVLVLLIAHPTASGILKHFLRSLVSLMIDGQTGGRSLFSDRFDEDGRNRPTVFRRSVWTVLDTPPTDIRSSSECIHQEKCCHFKVQLFLCL